MCGIAGYISLHDGPADPAVVAEMVRLLHHRGPDDHGFWHRGRVAFGHSRLSIIDVAGSKQPMHSVDDRVHLTFNGEILNYKELRRDITYPFTTAGDTEVLLALLREQGLGAARLLNGQFAFAVYDENDGSVKLVRDRMGILPLYYHVGPEGVSFASEIKALAPALPRGLEVDDKSIPDYLAHRSVPAPHTLFRDVRKVPPGACVTIRRDGRVTVEHYWSLPSPEEELHVDPAEAVELVHDRLLDSVQRALVADVPVGAYLSGGIDSSLIVAMMSRLRAGEGVETFSAGFGDPRFDELSWAKAVSTRFGTTHREVVVRPADFEALWPELTWHRDAPLSEPADIAVFRLAELARSSVKVALSGEGSDELFGGYPKYRYAQLTSLTSRLPGPVRTAVGRRLADRVPVKYERARLGLRALAASGDGEQLRSWFAPFTESERLAMTGTRGREDFVDMAGTLRGSALRRSLESDCRVWLPDNLLERGDRMSMAASLEVRPPFLDRDLVELAFKLPDRVKINGRTGKWVVKEVARRYLPADVINRPKVGFKVPLDEWFRQGLRDMTGDLLAGPDSFVSSVVDRATIRSLIASHESGRRNEEIRLWTLLSLEVWHRRFFRSAPALHP